MITISGNIIDFSFIEGKIINILSSSREVHEYDSQNQLLFEVTMRQAIVNAAIELKKSGLSFATFKKSRCNPVYWNRTDAGGFELLRGIKPSDAIKDIYINSSKYGTECSTAIVIIYYKALVDILPEELFNELFSNMYLFDWKVDRDLGISTIQLPKEYLPGDCRYFNNPDYNPDTPWWRGENTIDLGDGKFYGHDIGIKTAKEIIKKLNEHRISGSQISAYMLNSVTRPNFKYLANKYYNYISHSRLYQTTWRNFGNHGIAYPCIWGIVYPCIWW